MQRMPPNIPPRQNRESGEAPISPALNMARRIRSEQGAEQARQYLMDMEPYLAPAERSHIAAQLGVELPRRQSASAAPPVQPPPSPQFQPGSQSNANPFSMLGGMNGGNPLQLLQMLGGTPKGAANGAGAPGGMPGMGGLGNIMQLAQMMQMLGPMMGGKK